jgi:hypothetical protein
MGRAAIVVIVLDWASMDGLRKAGGPGGVVTHEFCVGVGASSASLAAEV